MEKIDSNTSLLQQLKKEGRALQSVINEMELRMTVLKKEEEILYNLLCKEQTESMKRKAPFMKIEISSSEIECEHSQSQPIVVDSKSTYPPQPKRIKTFHPPENESVMDVSLEELDLTIDRFTVPYDEEEEEEDEDDDVAAA